MKNKIPLTINDYIASFPKDIQFVLQDLRKTIKNTVPEAEEAMSYGIPTFKLNGKNLVHFGAFKNHIGFYPTPLGITAFKNELAGYKQAKGSVQFPLTEPLPQKLIIQIVEYRAKEVINGK